MSKRRTIQKQLVIDALRELGNHPTAQEIYNKIQEKYEGISVATVYSNLKSLVEEGEVRVLSFAGRADRYDYHKDAHCHVRCKHCGNFQNFPATEIAELNEQVVEATGYKIQSYEILFHGICPECQEKIKE